MPTCSPVAKVHAKLSIGYFEKRTAFAVVVSVTCATCGVHQKPCDQVTWVTGLKGYVCATCRPLHKTPLTRYRTPDKRWLARWNEDDVLDGCQACRKDREEYSRLDAETKRGADEMGTMIIGGHCRDCQHWRPLQADPDEPVAGEWGECSQAGTGYEYVTDAKMKVRNGRWAESEGALETRPDFGCTEFKPKES